MQTATENYMKVRILIISNMKKNYIKPLFRARKVEAMIMTPSSGHHDNGKHNGWNNPNNPHYPYNSDED